MLTYEKGARVIAGGAVGTVKGEDSGDGLTTVRLDGDKSTAYHVPTDELRPACPHCDHEISGEGTAHEHCA